MDQLFAICAPGLEPFLVQEIKGLGMHPRPVPPPKSGERSLPVADWGGGGVEFEGTLREIGLANLWLRTASRVVVRIGAFYATAFPELVHNASRLPWQRYLIPGQPVALRVTCHTSRLYHSDAVAERVAQAVGERLGRLSPVVKSNEEADTPPQLILVRIVNNRCAISVDTSGALLHKRGYRQAAAKAPLRETLAAGLLMATEWDTASPLLDPFCGSGTIAIEAALMARGIAPGHARRFSFMDWPSFDAATWPPPPRYARPLLRPAGEGVILASDRDAGALQSAQANAERAGVADAIGFACRAVSAIEPPPGPGWVVTNPPYGVRVSAGRDLRNLYAQFGHVLRNKCPGWRIAILCDDDALIRQTRLEITRSLPLVNGGLPVKLFLGQVA